MSSFFRDLPEIEFDKFIWILFVLEMCAIVWTINWWEPQVYSFCSHVSLNTVTSTDFFGQVVVHILCQIVLGIKQPTICKKPRKKRDLSKVKINNVVPDIPLVNGEKNFIH